MAEFTSPFHLLLCPSPCLCALWQIFLRGTATMATIWDDIPLEEVFSAGLGQWLTPESRCFGDKGDVEDITEGQWSLAEPVSLTHRYLADLDGSSQRISFPPSNLIILATIWLLVTRAGVWYFSRGMNRSASPTQPEGTRSRESGHVILTPSRRKPANTSSTPSFNPTNLNSTT